MLFNIIIYSICSSCSHIEHILEDEIICSICSINHCSRQNTYSICYHQILHSGRMRVPKATAPRFCCDCLTCSAWRARSSKPSPLGIHWCVAELSQVKKQSWDIRFCENRVHTCTYPIPSNDPLSWWWIGGIQLVFRLPNIIVCSERYISRNLYIVISDLIPIICFHVFLNDSSFNHNFQTPPTLNERCDLAPTPWRHPGLGHTATRRHPRSFDDDDDDDELIYYYYYHYYHYYE